jgi:hypothetical protein
MSPDALRALADAADALARLARAAAEETVSADDHLSLDEARVLARLRTTRPLREALRRGDLQGFGSQRTRTIRRPDLLAWIESRRMAPVQGIADADIERRVLRLAKAVGR